MTNDKEKILNILDKNSITYSILEHSAVFTIDETNNLDLENGKYIVKNLFLREDKKAKFFLIVLASDKKVNLKNLREKLNSRPLSFAQEKYLNKHLGLTGGSVSPFGVINDKENIVEIIFDEDLKKEKYIGIHPNINNETIFLNIFDLIKILSEQGNICKFITIP